MVTKSLKSLFKVKSGDGIAVSKLAPVGKYPVYGGNGIVGYTDSYNTEKNTMIIGRVGEKCGNVNVSQSKCWVSDNALVATPIAKYDLSYLAYLLEITNLNNYANRNAQPVISGKIIYSIEIPYVEDQKEQKAIANKIRSFDNYISSLSELIEKKKGIRDGALEDMVCGRIRLDGHSCNWIETELGKVADYRKERTTTERRQYISTENMNQMFAGIIPYDSKDIVEGTAFCKGDTLIGNIRPYLKKVWLAEFSGSCSADVLVLATNGKIVPKILYYYIANDRFINYVMTGGIKGIKMPRGDKKYIMHYSILLPTDIKEQEAIAEILCEMDKEIKDLEAEREKMIQIRKGAMNDLLTGKVRLSV